MVEGVRWRALPGDFPARLTVYTYFRNWRRTQYSSVKENCRRGTARIKLSLEEKILDAVPLHCIPFESN